MSTLHYWFTRTGRAEQIRLVLSELGVAWEEVESAWRSDAWAALQWDTLWFGAQPAWVEGDFTLTQSGVIVSYLARRHGLAPTDLRAGSVADALVWTAEDLRLAAATAQHGGNAGRSSFATGDWAQRWLPALDQRLERAGTGFLAASFSHADLAWFDAIEQVFDGFPELRGSESARIATFWERVRNRRAVAAYLVSARRPPPFLPVTR